MTCLRVSCLVGSICIKTDKKMEQTTGKYVGYLHIINIHVYCCHMTISICYCVCVVCVCVSTCMYACACICVVKVLKQIKEKDGKTDFFFSSSCVIFKIISSSE